MTRIILLWIPAILVACGNGDSAREGAPTEAAAALMASAAPAASSAASPASGQPTMQAAGPLDRTSALEGIDENRDGVRDDINRWIDSQGYTAAQKKGVEQLARAFQNMQMVNPDDKRAARAVAENADAAMTCAFKNLDPEDARRNNLVSRLEAMTANTKQRAMQYMKYDAALGGMAFTLSDDPRCD